MGVDLVRVVAEHPLPRVAERLRHDVLNRQRTGVCFLLVAQGLEAVEKLPAEIAPMEVRVTQRVPELGVVREPVGWRKRRHPHLQTIARRLRV